MEDDDKEKLHVLLQESNIAREEINNCWKQEIRAFFTFITLTGGAFLIMFKPELFQEYIRNDLLIFWMFFIGQIEFIVGLLGINQYSIISIRAGYLRAIENKINKLFDEPLVIWENEMASYWAWGYHGSFFWSSIIIGLFLIGIFVSMTVRVFSEDKLFGIIMVAESLIILVLVVITYFQADKVEEFAKRKLSVDESKLDMQELSNNKPVSNEK